MTISAEAGRVLGCLVEKQLTTPQQYPLTINALSLACNQVSNREPTMTLELDDVQHALDELKPLHLVRFVLPSHGKSVTRYRHVLDEAYGLDNKRTALLAVLLLRGPQTPGELRARTGRMAEFDSVGEVQGELGVLGDQPEPLVRLLSRRPGQKEERWQQLLAAESNGAGGGGGHAPELGGDVDGPPPRPLPREAHGAGMPAGGTGPAPSRAGLEERVEALSSELAAMRDQIAELSASLSGLRRSLGE